jgi:hypothetical protein
MDLISAWVLFPGLLLVLCWGCGVLVGRIAGSAVPPAIVPACGLATVIVLGHALTLLSETAELAAPVVLAAAIVGLALWVRARRPEIPAGAAVAGLAAFLAFGAPVLLSGEATFAGYIKLDDSATWMAFADRLTDAGRNVDDLDPSTYELLLRLNLDVGYPVGAFLPWAVASNLTGVDVAWTLQPYLSFLGGLVALAAYEISGGLLSRTWLRVVCAVVSAQPALLFAYAQWGGVKELAAAALLVSLAVLLAKLASDRGFRAMLPSAVVFAAFLSVLGLPGMVWLVPLVLLAGLPMARDRGLRSGVGRLAVGLGLLAILAVIGYRAGTAVSPIGPDFTNDDLVNLIDPLNPLQVFGIWPSGDFRVEPVSPVATGVLLALLGPALYLGVSRAVSRKSWPLLTLAAAATISLVAILIIGSPWIDAKALAIASVAPLLTATVGAAGLLSDGRPAIGGALLAALTAGVLWSNVLAYGEVWLAPRGQLEELERVGTTFDGQGPTLLTEFQPYGARHFLREADAEGASELRPRLVPLRDGTLPAKGTTPDTDELDPAALLVYRTLVLRRSPAQSRPPLPYRLVQQGDYYEVWQRPAGAVPVSSHLALGAGEATAAIPRCADVRALAAAAQPGDRLVAMPGAPTIEVPLPEPEGTPGWAVASGNGQIVPTGDGTLVTHPDVAIPGRYEIWVGGSVRGELRLAVDGASIGTVRQFLNNHGQYMHLGNAELDSGRHTIELSYTESDLHPGSAAAPAPMGPLVLRSGGPYGRLSSVTPAEASSLCNRQWDWIALVPGHASAASGTD